MRWFSVLLILAGWLHVGSAHADILVTDDTQRPVTLGNPAQRIVTLSPHATELVFAAGAGDRLVAVAPYSDFPPEAASLPTIGGLGGLDRERLLALAPDLVIAWDSGNRPADLAWLAQQQIAIYRSEPRELTDIARNLRDIGRLADAVDVADTAAARYLAALEQACPEKSSQRRAFIRLAEQPLLTVGGGHWMARAISRVGLTNIYEDLPGRTVVISEESLVARHPELILYLAYPGVSSHGEAKGMGLSPDLWARPGPRLPTGIARLCRRLAAE